MRLMCTFTDLTNIYLFQYLFSGRIGLDIILLKIIGLSAISDVEIKLGNGTTQTLTPTTAYPSALLVKGVSPTKVPFLVIVGAPGSHNQIWVTPVNFEDDIGGSSSEIIISSSSDSSGSTNAPVNTTNAS